MNSSAYLLEGESAAASCGTVKPRIRPPGLAIIWLDAYQMRKTAVCSVMTPKKLGWGVWTIAWQAWCRAAVQARFGMINKDANSPKNQQSAIDACIILKPSAVTVTANRPRESLEILLKSKWNSFSACLRIAGWDGSNKKGNRRIDLPGIVPSTTVRCG